MNNNIYPCLWFDGQAKEAAELYCSIFSNSGITDENSMVVAFHLDYQKFIGLNGGPMFKPNPSISFYVVCETVEEVESAWNKLVDGGSVMMPLDKYDWSAKYGWVQDKFGVSWQLSYSKMQEVGRKFSPALMFTGQQQGKAEQAVKFYTSLFEPSGIVGVLKYTVRDNDVEGIIKHAQFKLGNQVFMAMDSSLPHAFGFTEGISLVVECENQQEIDYYWIKFTEEGEESMCGWLKDKFGVSWQIIPSILQKLLNDPDRAERVTQAFMQMRKFEISKLLSA
jgi:predicted 3-demethylubiquinone-9 3-methyltransferase (glyoxalase superfamily)